MPGSETGEDGAAFAALEWSVEKLFIPTGRRHFGSRVCHGLLHGLLMYESCNESHRYDRHMPLSTERPYEFGSGETGTVLNAEP